MGIIQQAALNRAMLAVRLRSSRTGTWRSSMWPTWTKRPGGATSSRILDSGSVNRRAGERSRPILQPRSIGSLQRLFAFPISRTGPGTDSAALQHPSPARAVMIDDEIHAAPLDEERPDGLIGLTHGAGGNFSEAGKRFRPGLVFASTVSDAMTTLFSGSYRPNRPESGQAADPIPNSCRIPARPVTAAGGRSTPFDAEGWPPAWRDRTGGISGQSSV